MRNFYRKFLFLLLLFALVLPISVLAEGSNNGDNLLIFRRGNGYGDVLVSSDGSSLLSCGETCTAKVLAGDKLDFTATARLGSVFKGWSINEDNSNINPQNSEQIFQLSVSGVTDVIYAKFVLSSLPDNPVIAPEDRNVSRVMFWFGKVNQHWDLSQGVWASDADGIAGARENKLDYCRKFYPDTVKVVKYKTEFSNTWKNAGNIGAYISNKMSYRCVQADENISGEDVSNLTEKPNKGSVCYYFTDLPLCLPLSDPRAIKSPFTFRLDSFVSEGVDANSIKLGEGERAAVLKSYEQAFSVLPTTEEEFSDVIKISNGQWPSQTSASAETGAMKKFQEIYKRLPDMNNENDEAAITVMAYGLRQKAENRNLASESVALKTFHNIYKHDPSTTEEWNILQAITYSGAIREADSDGDFLSDRREKELGTDPNNKDSDGDGYFDGVEVANGYNPLQID
jgi:hypothetical protein